ncbi:hypothetical protein GQR58_010611 [Nymphon striatum]|nr:hypothetical protein GQR58_010611 [Nymphon striatum]
MHIVAGLLIGFSVFSAALLLVAHFTCAEYKDSLFPRISGMVLLVGLAMIQLMHLYYFVDVFEVMDSRTYVMLLFLVAPTFYFFSNHLLKVDTEYRHIHWLHFLPFVISFFIPEEYLYPWAMLFSFLLGSLYVVWITFNLYQLRSQRKRFKLELLGLGVLFVIAVMVVLLGFSIPLITGKLFFTIYAILIGGAFFIAQWILIRSPEITSEVQEAAKAAYTESTLKQVDKNAVLKELEQIVEHDKLYTNENLNLSMLADQLDLTTHQLSELINTQLGKSFSHYIREMRVNDAKHMLLNEPKASVLSVGLSVGFTTQSNFYTGI